MIKTYFSILLTCFLINSALSCSCLMRSIGEEIDSTDIVFTGQVINITFDEENRQAKIKMKVLNVFKGNNIDKNNEITISTNMESAACGIAQIFKNYDTYLIFGYTSVEGEVSTDSCTRTCKLESCNFNINEII